MSGRLDEGEGDCVRGEDWLGTCSVCVCVCVCVCACDGCTVMSDGGRNIGITDMRWLAADSMGKQQHKQITIVTCV